MPAKNESVALFFISVGKPKGLRADAIRFSPVGRAGKRKNFVFLFSLY